MTLQSTGDLNDAPPDGYLSVPPGEESSLVSLVNVSVVQAGAAAGSYTQTIGFELTIPGQLGAGAFDAQASAEVERGHPRFDEAGMCKDAFLKRNQTRRGVRST